MPSFYHKKKVTFYGWVTKSECEKNFFSTSSDVRRDKAKEGK